MENESTILWQIRFLLAKLVLWVKILHLSWWSARNVFQVTGDPVTALSDSSRRRNMMEPKQNEASADHKNIPP